MHGDIPYFKTKGLEEKVVLAENPTSTIIRPSPVSEPGDGFFSVCDHASRLVMEPATDFNRNSPRCHLSCRPCRLLQGAQPNSSPSTSETRVVLSRLYPATTLLYGVWSVGKLSKLKVQMVRTNSTELDQVSTPSLTDDLSRFSFSVDIPRNNADRAQMQEQIPTHPVASICVWDGWGFFIEKLPENLYTLSRGQVKRLRLDNIVRPHDPSSRDLVVEHAGRKFASVHDVLPTYP